MAGAEVVDQVVLSRPPSIIQAEPLTFALRVAGSRATAGPMPSLAPVTPATLPVRLRSIAEKLRRFVVQQHDATTLHFDFRLEVNGVLRSWAVPKGPSLDPAQRRLAQPVEDHSLRAGEFEGVHAQARRGSGAVIIWDRGTYRGLGAHGDASVPVSAALDDGHAVIELHGEKLQGRWALTRTATGKNERWVLVKMRDAHADRARDVVAERPESVVSGLTIEQLAASGSCGD
jgi:DNA ligase D-like protein (predicted 3'-phosphoesterase)